MTHIDPGDQRYTTKRVVEEVDTDTIDMFSADDAAEGRARRDEALDDLAIRNGDSLKTVRKHLRVLARNRDVTADDVRRICDEIGIPRGPWMGSVFRGKEWKHVGWINSKDPVQHSTALRVWHLRLTDYHD